MRLREWWRKNIAPRLLLLEAPLFLLTARFALALVPFPRLMHLITHPVRRAEVQGAMRAQQRSQVRRAIYTMRQRMHDQTTCLHRAIAAQLMLRRRGISTTLYFGATRRPGEELTIHAWVQDGTEGVVGHIATQKARYHIVAKFPADESLLRHKLTGGAINEQIRDNIPDRKPQWAEGRCITAEEARLDHARL